MLAALETPSLKDFFVMIGRVLLLGLAAVMLMKVFPSLQGDNFESLGSDLIMLAVLYPLARRVGFDIRKTGDHLRSLRREFKAPLRYFAVMLAALFLLHYAFAMALAPWDLPWTNTLLYWLDESNNPATLDSRISYIMDNPVWFPGYVVSICVIPPLVEEFIMRRWLYVAMRKRMAAFYAIALNGAFFGLLHGRDFFSTAIPGFFFCWAYERTGKIETPILMHVLINTFGLAMIFGDKLGF